jgi:hypothetical protein
MATFGDILKWISTHSEFKSSGHDRTTLVPIINEVYKQIIDSLDLPEFRYEVNITANVDFNTRIITLPYYVQELRAARASRTGYNIALNAPARYFQSDHWFQNQWEWKIVGHRPHKRVIQNATPLTFVLKDVTSEDVVLSINGQTDRASNIEEILTIPAGSTKATTINSFKDLDVVKKAKPSSVDLKGFDGDGSEVIEIANSYLEARHVLVQIKDPIDQSFFTCTCYQILYKVRPPYLWNDSDFIPDVVYQALYQKTLESIYETKVNAEGVLDPRAEMYGNKANTLLTNHIENEVQGTNYMIALPTFLGVKTYRGTY